VTGVDIVWISTRMRSSTLSRYVPNQGTFRSAHWYRTNVCYQTTIRILGGLLSAYYLTSTHPDSTISKDAEMYLALATDLGDRLLSAFTSPSGIPWSGVNLGKRQGIPDKWNQGVASLAEAASLQLELKYLSHLTGDMVYWRKAERVGSRSGWQRVELMGWNRSRRLSNRVLYMMGLLRSLFR
jgi:hypothetical protein